MGLIKVLMVREHYYKGKLRHRQTGSIVFQIAEGKELGLGFARICNEHGSAVFRMIESCDVKLMVKPGISIPHTAFNGESIEVVCERHFGYGDRIVTVVGYEDPNHLCQDTVVLVPPETPAQFSA